MKIQKNDLNKGLAFLFVGVAILVLVLSAINTLTNDATGPTISGQTEELRAVTVNGETITPQEVEKRQLLFSALGASASLSDVKDEMIREKVLLEEAQRRGVQTTREEVLEELELVISLSGVTLEELASDLEQVGSSYEDFIEYYQNSLTIIAMLDDELEGIEVTQEEVTEAANFLGVNQEMAREQLIFEKQDEVVQNLIEKLLQNAQIVYQ